MATKTTKKPAEKPIKRTAEDDAKDIIVSITDRGRRYDITAEQAQTELLSGIYIALAKLIDKLTPEQKEGE